MATRRKHVSACAEPGCPTLTDQSKCRKHRQERWRGANAGRPSARAQGYDASWEALRAEFLSEHPICAHCDAPAKDVHHLDGLGPTGPRGHDTTNLQGLCRSCHSRETGKQHGFGSR